MPPRGDLKVFQQTQPVAPRPHLEVAVWQSSERWVAGRQQGDNWLIGGSPRSPKFSDDQPISDYHPPAPVLSYHCSHPIVRNHTVPVQALGKGCWHGPLMTGRQSGDPSNHWSCVWSLQCWDRLDLRFGWWVFFDVCCFIQPLGLLRSWWHIIWTATVRRHLQISCQPVIWLPLPVAARFHNDASLPDWLTPDGSNLHSKPRQWFSQELEQLILKILVMPPHRAVAVVFVKDA